jgi:signal transduction histidine kinase
MLAAVALLLPAIIALGLWLYSQQDARRAETERSALDTARKVVALSDAELSANRRVLDVISTSPTLLGGEFATFAARGERLVTDDPDWNGLVVRDRASGAVLMEISDTADLPSSQLAPLDATAQPVEGIVKQGRYCPCVVLNVPLGDDGRRILTLFMSPEPFQRILMANATQSAVSALVDRDGDFVARTIDYENRIASPASVSVRNAIARGSEGIYEGVTLEGLENYSAYTSSPDTGWSAHIAIGAATLDSPRTWANAGIGLAILAALVLAAGLIFYAAYEMRRRRGEEVRFLEMQKAEAIGQFTGTVVHDFRNILAVVEAGLNLIVRQRTKEQTEKTIEEVRATLARGERLTNQLLSFVRGDGAEVRTIDLRDMLEQIEELLRRSLGDDIDFSWKVAEEARYARANLDQLELALLNLAINARDALAGPGRFTVATSRERDRVVIAVSDNGPGIPPHRREEVFALYYSTKPTGKGTGLGLAQVAGAMRQAEGRVRVTDNPGGGACFLLSLKAGTSPDAGEFVAPKQTPEPKPKKRAKPKPKKAPIVKRAAKPKANAAAKPNAAPKPRRK